MIRLQTLCLTSLLLVFPRPVPAALCTPDEVPAATLLVPAFAVDLDVCSGSPGVDTYLWITNVEPEAALAQVTLWTEGSVPALRFEIYLTGFDLQQIELSDVLCDGNLPATGFAVSPHGLLSDPPVAFPGCNNTTIPGAAPLYPPGSVGLSFRNHLHAWLTGQQSPSTGNCAAPSRGDNVARGYLTIDIVAACSLLFPTDPGYFAAGHVSYRNALVGRGVMIGPAADEIRVVPAVAIEADASGTVFQPGEHTFYGRYNGAGAADRREPLPSIFGGRSLAGASPFEGTELAVWREASTNGSAWSCAGAPAWAPVEPATLLIFDAEESAVLTTALLAWEGNTYGDEVGSPFAEGWFWLDLRHPGLQGTYGDDQAQGWVVVTTAGPGGGHPRANAFPWSPPCEVSDAFSAIFGDGFESGDVLAWDHAVP